MVKVAAIMGSTYMVFSTVAPIIRKAKAQRDWHMFLGANSSVEFSQRESGNNTQKSKKDIDREKCYYSVKH